MINTDVHAIINFKFFFLNLRFQNVVLSKSLSSTFNFFLHGYICISKCSLCRRFLKDMNIVVFVIIDSKIMTIDENLIFKTGY